MIVLWLSSCAPVWTTLHSLMGSVNTELCTIHRVVTHSTECDCVWLTPSGYVGQVKVGIPHCKILHYKFYIYLSILVSSLKVTWVWFSGIFTPLPIHVCRRTYQVFSLSVLGSRRNMAVRHGELGGRRPARRPEIHKAHSEGTKTHRVLGWGELLLFENLS